MTEKKEKKTKEKVMQKTLHFEEVPKSEIKIGEIYMSSPTLEMVELGNLILQLLEKELIQNYLKIIESKKKSGSYLG